MDSVAPAPGTDSDYSSYFQGMVPNTLDETQGSEAAGDKREGRRSRKPPIVMMMLFPGNLGKSGLVKT